jgi:hypothetical protein
MVRCDSDPPDTLHQSQRALSPRCVRRYSPHFWQRHRRDLRKKLCFAGDFMRVAQRQCPKPQAQRFSMIGLSRFERMMCPIATTIAPLGSRKAQAHTSLTSSRQCARPICRTPRFEYARVARVSSCADEDTACPFPVAKLTPAASKPYGTRTGHEPRQTALILLRFVRAAHIEYTGTPPAPRQREAEQSTTI